MKITLVLIKLLLLGALFIISNYNLHMGIDTERQIFFDKYIGWVGSLYDQGIEITSYVVKSEWLPDVELNTK